MSFGPLRPAGFSAGLELSRLELLENPRGATQGKIPKTLQRARVCTSKWFQDFRRIQAGESCWGSSDPALGAGDQVGIPRRKIWEPRASSFGSLQFKPPGINPEKQDEEFPGFINDWSTGCCAGIKSMSCPRGKSLPKDSPGSFILMSVWSFLSLAVLGNKFIPDLCSDSYLRKGVWHRQLQQVQPEVGIADWSSCLWLAVLSLELCEPWDSFSFDSKPCFSFALLLRGEKKNKKLLIWVLLPADKIPQFQLKAWSDSLLEITLQQKRRKVGMEIRKSALAEVEKFRLFFGAPPIPALLSFLGNSSPAPSYPPLLLLPPHLPFPALPALNPGEIHRKTLAKVLCWIWASSAWISRCAQARTKP